MCEGTYRSNCRLVLEGDDAFAMEQAYGSAGGELTLSFLPERDLEDEEGGEEADEEEEEEEEEEAAKGEGGAAWTQYMNSFVQVGRSPPADATHSQAPSRTTTPHYPLALAPLAHGHIPCTDWDACAPRLRR